MLTTKAKMPTCALVRVAGDGQRAKQEIHHDGTLIASLALNDCSGNGEQS